MPGASPGLNPRLAIARLAGFNLLGQVLPLVVAVVCLPVVVGGLGPARFGLLALSWTLVGYFGLVDLGFGRAATQRVARLGTDYSAIARVATSVAAAQAAVGVLSGIALWLASSWLATLLVAGDVVMQREAESVFRALAFALPGVLLGNAYRAVLEGISRFDLVNAVRSPFMAALFVVPAIGAAAGWSLLLIVVLIVASRWIAALLYRAACRRALGPGGANIDTGELRALLRFGGWVAISNVIIPAVIYLERLVISIRLGPESLGFYAAPHELMLKLLVLPAALTSVLFPLFSGLDARADRDRIGRGLAGSTRVIALVVAPAAALFVLLASPLLEHWLGHTHAAASTRVLQLLATAVFLNSLALVPFVLLEGAGRPDVIAKYHVLELPFYTALLWLLVGRFGLSGAAAAWLVRCALMTPLLFLLAKRHAAFVVSEPAARRAAGSVAAGALLIGVAHFWAGQTSKTTLLFAGLILLLLHALLAWRWLLDATERALVQRAVSSLAAARTAMTSPGD